MIPGDKVQALGAGVDPIEEEPRRRGAERLEQVEDHRPVGAGRRGRAARQGLGQYDTVVHVDLIGVQGRFECAGVEDRAQRVVLGFFRLQGLPAQGQARRAGRREGARIERHAVDEQDRGGCEVLLLQAGRAEAAFRRSADRQLRDDLEPRRQLAVGRVAEVGIVLLTHRGGSREAAGQLAFEGEVGADVGARLVDHIVRLKAREAAGANGEGWGNRPAKIGAGFSGADLVLLVPGLGAERNVERPGQSDVEFVAEVGIAHELVIGHFARVEGMRRRRPQGRVQGVLDPVFQAVPAVVQAEARLPTRDVALQCATRRQIIGVGVDQGQVAGGIDGGNVLARVVGGAERGCGLAVTPLAAGPEGGVPTAAQGLSTVQVEGLLFHIAVAEAGGDGRNRKTRIEIAPIGMIEVAVLGGQGQKSVRPELQALPAGNGGVGAVRDPAGAPVEALEAGDVLAIGDRGAAAVIGLSQTEVDDAGDGVGSVERRGAVTQNLDAVDRRLGNGVQVDGSRSPADGTIDVHQGRGVRANPVDQDQRLVGSLTAQGRRTDRIRPVGV